MQIIPLIYVQWPPALPFAPDVLPFFLDIAANGGQWLHLPPADTGKGQNMAVEALLQLDNTHILFLDWDHKHPADTVKRMASIIQQRSEIQALTGLYYTRTPPHRPCVWIEQDGQYSVPLSWEPGTVSKVSHAGLGCMMVSREVFEQIEPPWFMYDYSGMTRGGYKYPGADIYFCNKLKAAGIDIYCDFDLVSVHMGAQGIDRETFQKFRKTV